MLFQYSQKDLAFHAGNPDALIRCPIFRFQDAKSRVERGKMNIELVKVCSLRILKSLFYTVLCVILSFFDKQLASIYGKNVRQAGEKCTGRGGGIAGVWARRKGTPYAGCRIVSFAKYGYVSSFEPFAFFRPGLSRLVSGRMVWVCRVVSSWLLSCRLL